jgi:hypothetical protein
MKVWFGQYTNWDARLYHELSRYENGVYDSELGAKPLLQIAVNYQVVAALLAPVAEPLPPTHEYHRYGDLCLVQGALPTRQYYDRLASTVAANLIGAVREDRGYFVDMSRPGLSYIQATTEAELTGWNEYISQILSYDGHNHFAL